MNFTDIFIRRPVLAMVISFLILVMGLRAMFDLPLRQFPDVTSTTITVTTAYPGAPGELMQGFITTPLEQAISSVGGLDYVTSGSTPGVSTVTATLKLNYDANVAMTDIMAKVQQVKFQLPREANDPIILKSVSDPLGVLILTFASPEKSGSDVQDYIERVVKPLVATVEGVADLALFGGQRLAMRLWMDPDRMAARGVTADDVAAAIRANNFQSAPGEAKGVFVVTRVTAETGLTNVDDFKQMVVKSSKGALVRLSDVADVELGGQNYRTGALLNGDPSVAASVQAAPGANPLDIVKRVRALEPEIRRTLPPGMAFGYGYDVSEFINAAINEVIMTLVEAMLIVIVVIYLFLGTLRSVIIPVVTIPLSLIGAGALMLAMGFSLNLLTLLALVLAIGLVVDDAIVVVENVYRHIEDGQSPLEAALNGAREIVGPIVSMTITLAAVYTPIGFMSGLTGTLFREFAFTLAGAVVISGVVALTLSPMMASVLLKPQMNDSGLARRVEEIYARVTAWYAQRLSRVLDYRGAIAVFIVGIFAAIVLLYVNIQTELAPAEDRGAVLTLIKGPQTANIDYTTAYAQKLSAVMRRYPEVYLSFTMSGMQGENVAVGVYPLKPWSQRKRSAQDLLQDLQGELNKLDGVAGYTFLPPPLPGVSGNLPVSMVIYSPGEYRTIYDTMDKLKSAARDSGLFIVTDSDLTFNIPLVHVEIDRAKTHDLGISMQEIGSTLSTLVGENYINRFNMEGRAYQVIAQVPRERRLSPDMLTRYYVRTASGEQIPISNLVKLSTTIEPNSLPRFNQLNSATFSAMPMPGVSMGKAVEFLREQSLSLPRGFSTAFLSESRQYVNEGSQMVITFGFALLIIYLVLAAQFESLRDPLVIMFSVPMSMCGALLPLFFGLGTLNIYTQVGLVTLIGLITKHGILMVAFARTMQIEHGADRREAILEAARVRLRPILMTTAAMVAGLLPLLFASGAGAAARYALGLVVVAGMAIGTLFTLFVVPAVYTWIATDHRALARLPARAVPAE